MAVRTSRSGPAELQQRLRAMGAEIKTADDPSIPYDDFYSTPMASFVRLQTLDRDAAEAFRLLSELLEPPAWTERDFEDARDGMVASAERAASSASAIGRQMARTALYGDSWRSRSVFGTPATLRALSGSDLRQLSERYFVGRRMLLVVATSLPVALIQEMASQQLGVLPAGDSPPPLDTIDPIAGRLRRAISSSDPLPAEVEGLILPDSTVLRVKRAGGRQASLTFIRPLGRVTPEELPAVEVWNAALSAAIQFQLREREGLAYSIGSVVDRLPDGTLLWSASAGASAKSLGRILAGFQEEFARAIAAPPDSAAVQKQGAQLYGRTLMRRATRMNRAYAAGLAILLGGDPLKIDEEIRAPSLVTSGMIGRVLPVLRGSGPSLVAIAY